MSEALEIRDIDVTKTWVLKSTLNFLLFLQGKLRKRSLLSGTTIRKYTRLLMMF